MKKVVFFTTLIAMVLYSCSNGTKKYSDEEYLDEYIINSHPIIKYPKYIIGNDTVIVYENSSMYARVKSLNFLTKIEIRKVVDSLKITQNQVYFHLNNLTEKGEEYAVKSGSEIFIYNNPPKTKAEAIYIIKEAGINGQLEAIEFQNKEGINASNYNIKDSYDAISNKLKKLRFKRVNFKWNEYGEYTYYTLTAPNDNVVE